MPTIEEFAENEFRATCSELARSPPQEAVLRFYRRHDEAVASAIAAATTKPACGAGCSYCCNFKVVARAPEVVAIHAYVVARFKPEQLQAAIVQATRNVEEVKNLSHAEHVAINQPCPFLVDNKCSVYSVRPSKCRSFHATDVEGCKLSYEQPTNLNIPNSFVPEAFDAANGMAEGFNAALEKTGVDARVYDLNSAFLEAIRSGSAAKRLKGGKRVFLNSKIELPLQE